MFLPSHPMVGLILSLRRVFEVWHLTRKSDAVGSRWRTPQEQAEEGCQFRVEMFVHFVMHNVINWNPLGPSAFFPFPAYCMNRSVGTFDLRNGIAPDLSCCSLGSKYC